MPALRGAKLKADDIKCASNERQIHLAVVMYTHDHNNRYMDNILAAWQYNQLADLSNYVQNNRDVFHCPLSRGDCKNDGSYSNATVGGWTEYKFNDNQIADAGKPRLIGADLGSQLRPQKIVIIIDAYDWAPRHRDRENLCFFDGHVEMMSQAQYWGPEPGQASPVVWYKWGIED